MSQLTVVMGHSNPDSFSAALAEAYTEGAREAGVTVEVLSLPHMSFDPILRLAYKGEQPLEPDLKRAQEAISASSHVAWFFPMWWVGLPAELKGFIDRTFLPGWAYKYGSGSVPDKLLSGRSARVVVTMDSPRLWYIFHYGRALWRSFNVGTLKFAGFGPVRNTPIYNLRALTAEQREDWLRKVRELGRKDALGVRKAIGVAA